jgi:hypothetical protein
MQTLSNRGCRLGASCLALAIISRWIVRLPEESCIESFTIAATGTSACFHILVHHFIAPRIAAALVQRLDETGWTDEIRSKAKGT